MVGRNFTSAVLGLYMVGDQIRVERCFAFFLSCPSISFINRCSLPLFKIKRISIPKKVAILASDVLPGTIYAHYTLLISILGGGLYIIRISLYPVFNANALCSCFCSFHFNWGKSKFSQMAGNISGINRTFSYISRSNSLGRPMGICRNDWCFNSSSKWRICPCVAKAQG